MLIAMKKYRFDELSEDAQEQVHRDNMPDGSWDWPDRGREVVENMFETGLARYFEPATELIRTVGGKNHIRTKVYWDDLFNIVDMSAMFSAPMNRYLKFEKDFSVLESELELTVPEWIAFTVYTDCVGCCTFNVGTSGNSAVELGNDVWDEAGCDYILAEIAEHIYGVESGEDGWEPNGFVAHKLDSDQHSFFAGSPIYELFDTPEKFQTHLDEAVSKIYSGFEKFLYDAQSALRDEFEYINSQEYFAELAECNEWLFVQDPDTGDFEIHND